MNITDPYFDQIYNKKLLRKLEKRFGPIRQHHFDLAISSGEMINLMDKMNRKSRRGEVIMVIPNIEGQIWLHTKAFYPQGVYRLMTGGLEPGEKPHLAFQREAEEETGLKTKIDRCLAVITYLLQGQNKRQPFVSYVFKTIPTTGSPRPIDPYEAITGFKAVPASALGDVAQKLGSLPGNWADWGIFRAVAHDVVQQQLKSD